MEPAEKHQERQQPANNQVEHHVSIGVEHPHILSQADLIEKYETTELTISTPGSVTGETTESVNADWNI